MTTRLFEALHDPATEGIYRPGFHSNGRLATSSPVKPGETQPTPLPAAYPTRWGGTMTLEQIISDPQVRRAAFAKAGRLGLDGEDLEDCVQQGFIKLWQQLVANPNLLADKGPVWAGIYVAYSGDTKKFHRHNQRQQKFTDPTFGWQDADEYLELGRLSGNMPTRADWTIEADETIDVDLFINTMIQHYADDPKKLVALQAVTGAISSQEAARKLGLHKKNFAASIGNPVRQEVQALLPDNMKATRSEVWETQLARGEGTEHITKLAEEVMDNERLLLALYVVTTSVTKIDVAKMFGYGLTAFGKDISKIKKMIAAKYRRNGRI